MYLMCTDVKHSQTIFYMIQPFIYTFKLILNFTNIIVIVVSLQL